MSTLTIPNSFSPNTTIQSALMNGNFSAIASWANGNVDHTNINNSTGIYASQIIPTTTGQATFGGGLNTYTFNGGLIVKPGADAGLPLEVAGNSVTQSADLLDAYNFNGGTLEFSVGPTGNVAASGNLQAASDGVHKSFVPPAYTNTGAAVASTFHIASGQITIPNGSGTATVNLSGASVFAGTTYQVIATLASAANNPIVSSGSKATNSFAINLSVNAGPGGTPVDWFACGA